MLNGVKCVGIFPNKNEGKKWSEVGKLKEFGRIFKLQCKSDPGKGKRETKLVDAF